MKYYYKIIVCLIPFLFIFNILIPNISSNTIQNNISILDDYKTTDDYNYFNYDQMTNLLQNLSFENSDIMSLTSIGKTYQNRNIWMVKLSDNVEIDEDEPEVLFMGAHHGTEKPSFEVLIIFIKYLIENYDKEDYDNDNDGYLNEDEIDGVDNDKDGLIDEDPSESRVKEAIHNTEIYIILMVNPDGVEANTYKNCAPNYGPFGKNQNITSYGVNLNRNYGYKWYKWYLTPLKYMLYAKQFNTKNDQYRGEKPFCENETIAIRDFVNKHNFIISISYHTYGKKIVYPWIYKNGKTIDNKLFLSIGERISNINDYKLVKGSKFIKNVGNADDWLYGVHGIFAYTIELGKSTAPLEEEVVSNICKIHIGVNLLICEISSEVALLKHPLI